MRGIFDIVEQKKEYLGIPIISHKPMTIDDGKWIRCKNFVNSLPANYNQLFEAAEQDGWKITKVKTSRLDENKKKPVDVYIAELEKYVEDHRVILEIKGNEDKAVQKVTYYAFRNIPSVAYIREIVGGAY